MPLAIWKNKKERKRKRAIRTWIKCKTIRTGCSANMNGNPIITALEDDDRGHSERGSWSEEQILRFLLYFSPKKM